jgi:hypothetical protein
MDGGIPVQPGAVPYQIWNVINQGDMRALRQPFGLPANASETQLADYYSNGFFSPDWGRPNTWDQPTYNALVQNNFVWTQANLRQAEWQAALNNEPLICVYLSKSTKGSQQYLENTLPALMRALNGKGQIVLIDTDTYPPNSPIGKWRAAGHNISPYTRVYSVGADANGRPTRLNEVAGGWGCGWDIVGRTRNSVTRGCELMVTERPKFTDLAEPGRLAAKDMDETLTQIRAELAEADKAAHPPSKDIKDQKQIEAVQHYRNALAAADKFTPQQLHNEEVRLARELKAAKEANKEQKEIDEIVRRQGLVKELQEAQWKTRLELGLALGLFGSKEMGKPYILEAGQLNPALWARLPGVGPLPPVALLGPLDAPGNLNLLPSVGQRMLDNNYRPEDVFALMKQAQEDPKYKPFVFTDPPERRRIPIPEKKVEARLPTDAEIEAAYQFTDRTDPGLLRAMAEAHGTGKRLVIVYGSTGCNWCKVMERGAMRRIRQEDADSFVFAYVKADRAPGLMGVGQPGQGVTGFPTVAVYDVKHSGRALMLERKNVQEGNATYDKTQLFLAPYLKPGEPRRRVFDPRLVVQADNPYRSKESTDQKPALKGPFDEQELDLSANPYLV